MERIGIIFALQEEFLPVCETLGECLLTEKFPGFSVSAYARGGKRIYVTVCGVGEIRAAAAAQLLITKYGAECILNFGLAGGLTDDIKIMDTVLVDTVVQADFDCSACGYAKGRLPGFDSPYIRTDRALLEKAAALGGFPAVICASADRFVDGRAERKAVNAEFGAHICEMEAAGIQITAALNGVPALFVKTVSDGIDGGAAEFAAVTDKAAAVYCDFFSRLIEAV